MAQDAGSRTNQVTQSFLLSVSILQPGKSLGCFALIILSCIYIFVIFVAESHWAEIVKTQKPRKLSFFTNLRFFPEAKMMSMTKPG